MVSCMLLLLLCGTAVAIPRLEGEYGVPFTCSKEFIFHKQYCYRYFGMNNQKPFHHAQKLCSRHQSSLLSVLSWEEEEFVSGIAELNVSSIWLGLNDEDGPQAHHKEGLFKWSSGEVFEKGDSVASYCNWKIGEPENRRHLDCVKMDAEGWSMAPGGCAATKLPFICKKKACRLGNSCQDIEDEFSKATLNATPPGIQTTPSQIASLLMVLILLFGIALIGGVCCQRYIRTQTECFPT